MCSECWIVLSVSVGGLTALFITLMVVCSWFRTLSLRVEGTERVVGNLFDCVNALLNSVEALRERLDKQEMDEGD